MEMLYLVNPLMLIYLQVGNNVGGSILAVVNDINTILLFALFSIYAGSIIYYVLLSLSYNL